jgi:multidrug resistance efflux pump
MQAMVEMAQAKLAQAKAMAQAARAKVRQSEAALQAAQAKLAQVNAEIAKVQAMVQEAEAGIHRGERHVLHAEALKAQSQAALTVARIVRGYTEIRSLTDGYVVERLVATGNACDRWHSYLAHRPTGHRSGASLRQRKRFGWHPPRHSHHGSVAKGRQRMVGESDGNLPVG